MAIKPGKYNPLKPDVELFDYKSKKRFGLKLEGSGGLQIGTISQDDTVHIRAEGKRVGDFDEQRSWKAGRGIENLSDNAAGYWDSQNAWTLSEGHLHQTLLWQFSKGIRSNQLLMPDTTKSVAWKQLFGASRYMSVQFTADETLTAAYTRMWIRRVGTPGTLTFELCNNGGGNPGTVIQSATATADDFADVISVLFKFDHADATITSGTIYHVKIYGASTDNGTNHWEVGGNVSGSTGKESSNGSSWGTNLFDIYYYIADADVPRKFFSFVLDGAFYVVDKKDSGANSQLWLNGDRGVVSSATSGSVTDSTKSWTVNVWAGARVKIVRGTGLGQTLPIASNTATALTLTGTFSVTPDTTSEYIIYGTNRFTEITGTGLSLVYGVTVANRVVYFAQSSAHVIRHMIYNATTKAHAFGDQTTGAVAFIITTSDSNGTRVWGLQDSVLYWAAAQAYSTSPATLVWTAANSVAIGDTTSLATGLVEKDGFVYAFKEDGVWNVSPSLSITKLVTGIEKTPSILNGLALISHQQFLYYSWMHSLIRIYGSSHDDIGQDWAGQGLPDGREGSFSSLDSYTSLLMCGIDAGTGTSSVLGWDGIGWHELFRAYDSNMRIRFIKIQVCPETRNRFWIDCGGDLVFQEMPLMKGSPRLDSGARYFHEAVIESSAIDMGTASSLPKFIKELTVYSKNLGDSNRIEIDYQIDDDVHTTNWTNATTLYQSPESVAFLGLSNIRKFAYRMRIISEDNTSPLDILGVIPNGFARVPYKMVWTLRCKADNISSRGRLVKPDMLMRWLLDNARYPGRIEMQSQYELAHKYFVIVHPPRMFPYKPGQNGQAEESVFTLVLEEA